MSGGGVTVPTVYIRIGLSITVCRSCVCVFFQAEDGIRDLVRSRGLGDVYKRQPLERTMPGDFRSGEQAHIVDGSEESILAAIDLLLSLIHI